MMIGPHLLFVLITTVITVGGVESTPNEKNGKGKQGRWTEYLDAKLSPVLHDSNASVVRQLSYKDGVPCDTLKEFDRQGRLLRSGVVVGKIRDTLKFDGLVTSFYTDGAVKEEITWSDGTVTGPYLTYYESGELRLTGYHSDGVREGLWTAHFPNGDVKTRGRYSTGLREGVWEYRKENGSVDSVWYIDGSPVDAFGFLQLAKRAAVDRMPDRALNLLTKAEALDPSFRDSSTSNWVWAQAVRITIDFIQDRPLIAQIGLDKMIAAIAALKTSDPNLLVRISEAWTRAWTHLGFFEGSSAIGNTAVLTPDLLGRDLGPSTLVRLVTELSRQAYRSKETQRIDSLDGLLHQLLASATLNNDDDTTAALICWFVSYSLRAFQASLSDDEVRFKAMNDSVVAYAERVTQYVDGFEIPILTQAYVHLYFVGGIEGEQLDQFVEALHAVDTSPDSDWWLIKLQALRIHADAGDHVRVLSEICSILNSELPDDHPTRIGYAILAAVSAMEVDDCNLLICVLKHTFDLTAEYDDDDAPMTVDEIRTMLEQCEESKDPELRRYREQVKRM